LKHDQFVDTTAHGLEWASQHRRTVMMTISSIVVAVLVIVAAVVGYNMRSSRAADALGAALATYQTQIAPAGEAVPPGMKTFSSVAERAKAANQLFTEVADRYNMTPSGRTARYFSGLAYLDQGQTDSAESALKTVSGGWNRDLASLSKLALAQIYRQTGRTQQAIDLYNQIAARPTKAVPASTALLQLAELYESQNQPDQAKKIYAQIKDKDPKGAGGMIAARRLSQPSAPPAF
ncbi:MAG: tetratricopeptide repeat protein, partial [Acidobacteriaceae bacterium]|nr:tetratricopeptide repeat protein [Acidobacteriaceae bacterium]